MTLQLVGNSLIIWRVIEKTRGVDNLKDRITFSLLKRVHPLYFLNFSLNRLNIPFFGLFTSPGDGFSSRPGDGFSS